MVTFSCDNCNDTVKKPKANQHAQRCRGSLTCIDCSKTFWSGEWNAHNSCISEAEAYQGALYKPTKKELKRKAADLAAEQAKSTKLVVESPAAPVVGSVEEVLPSTAAEKRKKTKTEAAAAAAAPMSKLDLLASVLSAENPISLHKALKLLRAQNKLDKESEKVLMKEVLVSKASDGSISLRQST